MEKNMETIIMGYIGLGLKVWKEWKTKWKLLILMGYIGTTIRIHSFIPTQPKAS